MLAARAEDLTQEIDGVQDDRNLHAIQWHLGEEEYGRVMRMEACYQCLTTGR